MSIFNSTISSDYSTDLLQQQFNDQNEVLLIQQSKIQQIEDMNIEQNRIIQELTEKINALISLINVINADS
jgi:hypothetical protein